MKNPKSKTVPKFHSSSDQRESHELPAEENLNDQVTDQSNPSKSNSTALKTNLGNGKKTDKEDEKLITP